MTSQIISLNIGGPTEMHWGDRSVLSSMHKKSIDGPLIVHTDRIEGDSFANHKFHGTTDSVLYAFGLDSIHHYLNGLGLTNFQPGDLGETLTLDRFDEHELSIGDVFKIGDVLAQVTYPRIPCAKLNFRLQHANAHKHMMECGRSGVYFRILEAGLIHKTDSVTRVEQARVQLPLGPLYRKLMALEPFTDQEFETARANGCVPQRQLEKWLRPKS